jgi:hypothetical protein
VGQQGVDVAPPLEEVELVDPAAAVADRELGEEHRIGGVGHVPELKPEGLVGGILLGEAALDAHPHEIAGEEGSRDAAHDHVLGAGPLTGGQRSDELRVGDVRDVDDLDPPPGAWERPRAHVSEVPMHPDISVRVLQAQVVVAEHLEVVRDDATLRRLCRGRCSPVPFERVELLRELLRSMWSGQRH